MNFKSLVNEIGCDSRIKNGTLDLKNEDHVFVLQEYLEKAGYDINEIVEKTARLFEAGRFPERQAYNKDGILVTFPNKQYRDRAVNKGTHFAENPKRHKLIFSLQTLKTESVNNHLPAKIKNNQLHWIKHWKKILLVIKIQTKEHQEKRNKMLME